MVSAACMMSGSHFSGLDRTLAAPPTATAFLSKKDAVEWTPAEVRAFFEATLPGHECVSRFAHLSGRVLCSMAKDDLRKQARDEEVANVVWAELQRLHEKRREHEDIAAHGAEQFTLFIRTPVDVAVELDVRPTDTVHDVKLRVAGVEGTAIDMQRLMWNGVPMLDSRTLASYSIVHGSVVLLVPRLASTSHRYAPPPARNTAAGLTLGSRVAAGAGITRGGGMAVASGAASALPRPRVPLVCNDIARPFPMHLEFPSIPEYQDFMLAVQRQASLRRYQAVPRWNEADVGGRDPRSSTNVTAACDDNAPFMEILPAHNNLAPVQTRILFDAEAEVLLIDTVGDILMEHTRYKCLLHLRDDQKMTTLVTGQLADH